MINKENSIQVDKVSVRELFSTMKLSQVWGLLSILVVIVSGSFAFGQFIGSQDLRKTESELNNFKINYQSIVTRSEFFERAFEYYRTLELWRKSINSNLPFWNIEYPCDQYAMDFSNSIYALHKTVDKLRKYSEDASIGFIDPRGVDVLKVGGSVQVKFSKDGDVWTIPRLIGPMLNQYSGKPVWSPCFKSK